MSYAIRRGQTSQDRVDSNRHQEEATPFPFKYSNRDIGPYCKLCIIVMICRADENASAMLRAEAHSESTRHAPARRRQNLAFPREQSMVLTRSDTNPSVVRLFSFTTCIGSDTCCKGRGMPIRC